jgi:phage-related protein
MSHSIKVSGGCSGNIECKGVSETTSEFSNKFESTSKKIERMYKTLEKAILDATNNITGNTGGYVILHDTNNDGKPDEMLIMDIEDITLATKVWRWNKSGLGYSFNAAGNAYLGPYRTAITADGQINADFITTGTLNAERIAVETYNAETGLLTDFMNFHDGIITLGKGDSSIKLKLENEQVAFYRNDTRIGLFSPNSFEIENLTGGRIRFQNFGYIPRPSGNLTFTKLT